LNPTLSPNAAALCPSRFTDQPAQFAVAVLLWMYDRMVDAFSQLVNGVAPTETTRELLPVLREHRAAELADVWVEGRRLEGDERDAQLIRVFGTTTPTVIEGDVAPEVAAGD
jgi:hypothetical protein